jgi:hypothetical protein
MAWLEAMRGVIKSIIPQSGAAKTQKRMWSIVKPPSVVTEKVTIQSLSEWQNNFGQNH